VPTYEYQCDKCQRVFEVRQRISEAPLTSCDVCGGAVRRLISPAPFILKGDGWYVTDYPSESRKKAMDAEKSSSPSSDKADKPAAASTTSESKTDSKSDGGTSGASSSASTPSSAAKPSD
jgi:putative FmdB family regulatory protein